MSNAYNVTGEKIFITGGAGFIGSRMALELAGDNEIILFDNLHNNAYKNSSLRGEKNVKLLQGDVRDIDSLNSCIEPDVSYVIHAAAIAGVDTVIADPLRVLDVNIKGTFNVAEVALKLKHLKRFIDFSTSEVFGQHAYNVDEFTISPKVTIGEARWTYAISKLVGEFVVHSHHVKNSLPSVTVRPFNIYGPNQVGVGAIHHFVRKAIAGDDLTVHDDGSQIRSWCYVDDFVNGVFLAMTNQNAIGKSYNIGNPRSTLTVYNLASLIIDLCKSNSKIIFKPMNHSDVALRIPNINLARQDLNYEPIVELEEGLRRTIEWYSQKA